LGHWNGLLLLHLILGSWQLLDHLQQLRNGGTVEG
jgi:hypothetical protein